MKQRIIFLILMILPLVSFAVTTDWQIKPQESSLTFTATQNNAPVSGKFKNFSGEIHFNPAELKTSHIRIVVDMGSVSADYADVSDTLKTADWFNAAVFPQAIFTASDFNKTGENSYQANGMLTIRNKTIPVVVAFVMKEFSEAKARATGSVMLKRLAFGVGQGDWAKTDNVKDDVEVQFTITAVKKP